MNILKSQFYRIFYYLEIVRKKKVNKLQLVIDNCVSFIVKVSILKNGAICQDKKKKKKNSLRRVKTKTKNENKDKNKVGKLP